MKTKVYKLFQTIIYEECECYEGTNNNIIGQRN